MCRVFKEWLIPAPYEPFLPLTTALQAPPRTPCPPSCSLPALGPPSRPLVRCDSAPPPTILLTQASVSSLHHPRDRTFMSNSALELRPRQASEGQCSLLAHLGSTTSLRRLHLSQDLVTAVRHHSNFSLRTDAEVVVRPFDSRERAMILGVLSSWDST